MGRVHVETGRVFRLIHKKVPPPQENLPTAELTGKQKLPDQLPSEWAYFKDPEGLVFPVCTVGACRDHIIITKPAKRYGLMILDSALSEKDATDILKLHFEERHGMKNIEDILSHGYLLPRKLYVRP